MLELSEIKKIQSILQSQVVSHKLENSQQDFASDILTHSKLELTATLKVGDLTALFVGFSKAATSRFIYLTEGTRWNVFALKSADQAIRVLEGGQIDFVFISIEGSDEFAPALAHHIRKLLNGPSGTGRDVEDVKVIAVGNHIPRHLHDTLIRSGVDEVVKCQLD